jgi:hypothetical protein
MSSPRPAVFLSLERSQRCRTASSGPARIGADFETLV